MQCNDHSSYDNVGDNAVIGTDSVALKYVPNGETGAGNPIKEFERRKR